MLYGNVLKELRDKIKIKQKDLAKILDINENLYCMYENEYQIILLKHLNELCNYFNVSLDYIFGFTDILQYDNNKKDIDKVSAGLRLKEFRKEHKLTLVKLAEKLNVVNTIISEYEKHMHYIVFVINIRLVQIILIKINITFGCVF